MRKVDAIILLIGGIEMIFWTLLTNMDGFKGNNSTIVARSIAITATIDGQVENNPPKVGAWVNSDDLLARIYNNRFDRGRLIEYETQIAFLESEIANIQAQQASLGTLQDEFEHRADAYAHWILNDLELNRSESSAQLDVAKARKRLEDKEVQRVHQLYTKKLTSEVDMQIAKTEAEIASAQVELNTAQWNRSELMLQTMVDSGVFFENGDTSYWAKMVDTLSIRHFDNLDRVSMLEAQLIQARAQAKAETTRTNSSFAEEHLAPFTGVINARYVTQGTKVTSGTNLLQILDCANPIIIIPIPDNRISEFSVGLEVTVYPTDSEQALPGKISYISSGPMMGSDTSIQLQQDITLDGNRAIVSLDEVQDLGDPSQSCETARKAVVVIHTRSVFDTVAAWF